MPEEKTLEQLVEDADKGVKAIQELMMHPEREKVQHKSTYTAGRWFSTGFSGAAKDYLGFRLKPEPMKDVFDADIPEIATMPEIVVGKKFAGKK